MNWGTYMHMCIAHGQDNSVVEAGRGRCGVEEVDGGGVKGMFSEGSQI